jgi:hypothetical protein
MLYLQNRVMRKEERKLKTNTSTRVHPRWRAESVITAIAIGAVFIIIGAVFVLTPDLPEKIVAFFQDIKTEPYPFPGSTNSTISLPAPSSPASHVALYGAVMQFAIGITVLQIIILALRLRIHSSIGRIAETLGNLFFWLGAALLTGIFLNAGATISSWFAFWSALIAVVGASMVTRAAVLFAKRARLPPSGSLPARGT